MAKPSILSPFKAIKYLFKKPRTLRYPFELKEPSPRYRGFHLNDWDKCAGCGNCADICPNEAITMVEMPKTKPGEKNERPKIDYGRCCFCGLCMDVCPLGSLRLSKDYLHIHFATDSFLSLAKDERSDKEHFLPAKEYSIFKASLAHRKVDNEGFISDPKYSLLHLGPPRYYEDHCIACGTCFRSCPVGAITLEELGEKDGVKWRKLRVDYGRCISCGRCEANCPVAPKGIQLSAKYDNEDRFSSVEVPIGGKKMLEKKQAKS